MSKQNNKSSTTSNFNCPISPYIMWDRGLRFKECPICSEERDMIACEKCSNRGDSTVRIKHKKKHQNKRRKDTTKIERRGKEAIPKIGKTYNSK